MTMRNRLIGFISVVMVLFGLLMYNPNILHGNCIQYDFGELIKIEDITILVKKVDDAIGREKGLSGACPLKKNTGMLFEFETPGFYGFWMKDMTYALDMIWLDSDMKIVDTKTNITPDTYPTVFYPQSQARYVLELKAGSINELGLKNKTD